MRLPPAVAMGLLLTLDGVVHAQSPPPAIPPPPPPQTARARMDAVVQPERGTHLHDGFYLRFGVGAGYAAERIEANSQDGSASSLRVDGTAVPIDFALGGTLGRGFVLGGVLHTTLLAPAKRSNAPMPEAEREDHHAATLSVLGLYADWYLDPASGFHLQGMLGAGTLLLSDTADSDYAPAGSAACFGAGYEWWIGPDSSAGLVARADWASLVYEDDDEGIELEHTLLQVGVMGTVTYH
ncbi:MAG: hypothetical protein ACOC1F_12955 [Myxococcota bacterium]